MASRGVAFAPVVHDFAAFQPDIVVIHRTTHTAHKDAAETCAGSVFDGLRSPTVTFCPQERFSEYPGVSAAHRAQGDTSMNKPVSGAVVALLFSLATNVMATDACIARSSPRTMPLVELYTSEGCSSCPPADRWLSEQVRSGQANFLAFHVDYWDDIGWPDRFASAQYSQRQRARVEGVGQRTVYTPQVMVGSSVQASWRSAGAWRKLIEKARQPSAAALTLRLQPTATGWQANIGAAPVGVQSATSLKGAQLLVARYVDAQVSDVRAGENRGVILRHDRVVQQLSGPWALPDSGALSRQIDLPTESAPWGVTAFVQDARGNVLQSVNLPAGDCNAHKLD